jgi:hypothetical protein
MGEGGYLSATAQAASAAATGYALTVSNNFQAQIGYHALARMETFGSGTWSIVNHLIEAAFWC